VESLKRFGSRIRTVRDAAHLKRHVVAEKAHISLNYLGQIERGEKWPALEVIEAIASAIGVSPAAFFDFDAEQSNPAILQDLVARLIENRDTKQLQDVLRVLKALLVA
jgi:transcriptional regulator with XRE-family HTH domain